MKITVLGDGGWGTALALQLCENSHDVTIWGYDEKYLDEMNKSRENSKFLSGVKLPQNLSFEADMKKALAGADFAVSAIPTTFLRSSLVPGALPEGCGVLSVTKGIEKDTLLRPSQMIEEIYPGADIAILSGPSHAEEVARKMPVSVVVASKNEKLALMAQEAFNNSTFRVYTSPDPLGVELGGALKNVLAVAAGVCIGLNLGDNTLAALITRGLAEMTRLGTALGADTKTFYGLSGIGDLIVTCTSTHGRNRAVGIELGKGRTLDEIMSERETVAEGVASASGVLALAQKTGTETPITEEVNNILYSGKSPQEALLSLMSRLPKEE